MFLCGLDVCWNSAAHQRLESKPNTQTYTSLDPTTVVPGLVAQLRNHALFAWVFMPLFVVAQGVVPQLHPTCAHGYQNFTLIAVVVLLAHHLYAESLAWAASKALLAEPEITVMRHFGVLRRRRRMVLVGMLEDLVLYTTLVFPVMAQSCDAEIHDEWVRAWEQSSFGGELTVEVVRRLKFWICASILCMMMVLSGLVGACELSWPGKFPREGPTSEPSDESEVNRLHGKDFFDLARYAEFALTPSVATLCEQMGLQKRWVLDSAKDAREGANAQFNYMLGAVDFDTLQAFELNNQGEREAVDIANQMHSTSFILVKILLGIALPVWLQASFYELTYNISGNEAKYKVVAGMWISGLLILAHACRCSRFCIKLGTVGCLGVIFQILSISLLAWSAAKIYYGKHCKDHLWNLTTGCVPISG